MAVLVLLSAGPARPEIEFTLTVDRSQVSASQPILLTLRLSAETPLSHLAAPTIDLREFIVHGPSVMDMESHDHRGARFTRELKYTLYARNPGRFALGPARLQAEGEVLTTEEVEIHVSGKPAAGRTPKGDGEAGERELEDDLFVRVEADRDTAYVGEQVNVRFDLCYRYHLRGPRLAEVPEYTGFWVKELFAASRLDPHREVIQGLPFQVAPLRHVVLFPTASGPQVIDPLGLTCSLLEDPIFGRSRALMIRSEPVSIYVRPLPEQGRPGEFAGAVGEFGISVEARPRDVRVGDPVTLKVSITGTGNVQSIPEPALHPRGFEVYEPKVEVEEGRSVDGRYMASRRLEYILIPGREGRLEIPALTVAYFDPAAHRYRTASSAPMAIHSRPDSARPPPGRGTISRGARSSGSDATSGTSSPTWGTSAPPHPCTAAATTGSPTPCCPWDTWPWSPGTATAAGWRRMRPTRAGAGPAASWPAACGKRAGERRRATAFTAPCRRPWSPSSPTRETGRRPA